jgi:hypothetical protein
MASGERWTFIFRRGRSFWSIGISMKSRPGFSPLSDGPAKQLVPCNLHDFLIHYSMPKSISVVLGGMCILHVVSRVCPIEKGRVPDSKTQHFLPHLRTPTCWISLLCGSRTLLLPCIHTESSDHHLSLPRLSSCGQCSK